mmetsp:Transcript_118225/g.312510  ORF Transcript_118225/g.312510 Transcript_118225/m.312510 type:complete len:214 (+) Transcript_118225:441-1082(+)
MEVAYDLQRVPQHPPVVQVPQQLPALLGVPQRALLVAVLALQLHAGHVQQRVGLAAPVTHLHVQRSGLLEGHDRLLHLAGGAVQGRHPHHHVSLPALLPNLLEQRGRFARAPQRLLVALLVQVHVRQRVQRQRLAPGVPRVHAGLQRVLEELARLGEAVGQDVEPGDCLQGACHPLLVPQLSAQLQGLLRGGEGLPRHIRLRVGVARRGVGVY